MVNTNQVPEGGKNSHPRESSTEANEGFASILAGDTGLAPQRRAGLYTDSPPLLDGEYAYSPEFVDAIQALEALACSTEDEFLYIGSKLGDFHNRAIGISIKSYTVASRISGEEIENAIEALHGVADRVSEYLTKSQSEISQAIESLAKTSGINSDIRTEMNDLRSALSGLRMLGFSTMIENAGLKKPEQEIENLGRDVQKLSFSISQRILHIGNAAAVLDEVIENSLSVLNRLHSKQQASAAEVLRNTVSAIDALDRKYRDSAPAAQSISSKSGNISADMGSIVTSLQFHDITRQQFESSRMSFQEMHSLLPRRSSEMGSDAISSRFAGFCRREVKFLKKVSTDFTRALEEVLRKLQDTVINIRGIVDKAEKVAGKSSQTETLLSGIERLLSVVHSTASALSESSILKRELFEAVRKATAITEKMSAFVITIEEIGDDVELLAFNAAVKADRMGGEGRPLAVIADFIQRIATETRARTGSLSKMIKEIIEFSDAMVSHLGSEAATADEEIGAIVSRIAQIVQWFRALNRDSVALLDDIQQQGRDLSRDVEETAGSISVHTHVGYVVNSIIETLQTLSSGLQDSLPESVEAEVTHRIHGSDRAPGESETNIELF